MIATNGYNDRIRHHSAGGGLQHECLAIMPHSLHGHAAPHRRIEGFGIGFDVSDDVVLWHEPERLRTGIRKTWKLALPIWRDETKTVPPLGAPGMRYRVPLEHNVPDICLLQAVTCR